MQLIIGQSLTLHIHWSAKQQRMSLKGCKVSFFPYFGLPSIIQSDNGKEFVNAVLKKVVQQWPGKVQLISGRPRHPQSQGLVEQAHHTLERMIAAKMQEDKQQKPAWSKWLPHIICECC